MHLLGVFLKGFAMGAANVVPGVSGGTVAFITGIYERLINALKSFDVAAVKLLLSRDLKALAKHLDLGFLVVLGLGVVGSVLTLAKVLEIGFEEYPIYVSALFFGLILASVFSVAKMIRQWSFFCFLSLAIGLFVAVGMAFAPVASENTNALYLMLCGVVAMCSMIIPGVSGSFVLLLMGNYQLIMISSVNKLRAGEWGEALSVLTPVAVGAGLGLIVLSRVLGWLFKKYHDNAVAVITGFVTGSLVIIWPWKNEAEVIWEDGEKKVLSYESYFPSVDMSFWIALAMICVGVILMYAIEKLGAAESS